MSDLHLIIRTPDAVHYDGPASRVSGASELGDLQIYPGHAAMTAAVDFSRVLVEHADHQETFLLKQGILHTDPESRRTEFLALSCQKVEEADLKTLRAYRDFILDHLQKREDLGSYHVRFLEESMLAVEKQIEKTPEDHSKMVP